MAGHVFLAEYREVDVSLDFGVQVQLTTAVANLQTVISSAVAPAGCSVARPGNSVYFGSAAPSQKKFRSQKKQKEGNEKRRKREKRKERRKGVKRKERRKREKRKERRKKHL